MQHFERRQLRAVPYKGPVLAQSAYGDLGLRSFSDLDFLISPADFERAKQALAEIGYRPSTELTPAVERFWLRTGYERSFDGAGGKASGRTAVGVAAAFLCGRFARRGPAGARRPHRCRRMRSAVPRSRRFAAGALPARRQASLDAADLARGYCGDFAGTIPVSIPKPDHRLRAGYFAGARSGNRAHSRRKFLAGEERASGGASRSPRKK